MKKTFAIIAMTILFLSVGVLAFGDYATATKVQLDTMSRKSADSVCGPITLTAVEKDKVQFRLNGNLYDVPRPEAVKNEAALTMLKKEDCAVKVLSAESTQYVSSIVLSFMSISENQIYFNGNIFKLRKNEKATEILGHQFECQQANKRDMLIKVDAKPYMIKIGETIKSSGLEIKGENTQVGALKYGNSLCVINVKKSIDINVLETPTSTGMAKDFAQKYVSVKNPIGGLFKGISGKVTYSPEEQVRLENKLSSTTQDKLDDDQRQLELDKVGGKFGGDVTGKVAYQVNNNKVKKVGTADVTNAKRLSATKKLSPTVKSTTTNVNAVSGKFKASTISGKATYDPSKVTYAQTVKPKALTATGYKVKTQNAEKTVVAEQRQGTGTASEKSRFGGKITGKAVDETEPVIKKGFFAKLLSSIFGI